MAQQKVLGWEEIADYFDEKQGDEGDLWHRELINPTLLRVLGNVSGRRVLDLACGNGALARQLARKGAKVVGVDLAPTLVARAQRRESRPAPTRSGPLGTPLGISYHVSDAGDLGLFGDGAFDVVVCNMGVLDMTDDTAHRAFKEAARVLTAEGRLVMCTQHPCFEGNDTAAWVVEKLGRTTTVWRKVARYREHYEMVNNWRVAPGQFLQTISYHRPLSWYVRSLREAGLAVTAFEENEPTEEFILQDNEGAWIKDVPLHCVIEARKLG
ncbi:MAG: class I SAM-dependent methyltransferase [Chloroflexi bacterium]|nr:class I SAM-dependent methyltransferase [Chloroflexota bacterium]